MKKTKKNLIILGSLMSILLVSCSNDDSEVSYNLSQESLDAVANFVGDYTGGRMAHGGPDGTSADSTVREVFSSTVDLSANLPVGTIVTKNTYKRDADGNKTDLLYVSFAMVKHEIGYNSEGGDWEYIKIPYDETIDYTTHPYGILPEAESENRGKLVSCMGCHSAAPGGDYLYVNE